MHHGGHSDPAGMLLKSSAEFWMNLQMTYDLRNTDKALPGEGEKAC